MAEQGEGGTGQGNRQVHQGQFLHLYGHCRAQGSTRCTQESQLRQRAIQPGLLAQTDEGRCPGNTEEMEAGRELQDKVINLREIKDSAGPGQIRVERKVKRMGDYRTILYEPGPITRIIHNEPEKNNVMGAQFQEEFLDAVRDFEGNREAKVAVSLARGKHFAAGHDISTLGKKQSWEKGQSNQWSEARWRVVCDPRKWVYQVWDITKPLVVGAQGAALAAGAQFVMLHDIIVMGENSLSRV